jgi:hypothetical protein
MASSDLAVFGRRFWHGRRARRSYRLGQDLAEHYRNTERGARLANQCYRRALRLLGKSPDVTGDRSLAAAVRARLAETTIHAALWRHRGAAALVAGAALLLAGVAVAFVPPVRHAVFPVDLADGKHWVASSAWPNFTTSGFMTEATHSEGFFHTVEEMSPMVTVDLGGIKQVHAVKIENRRDSFSQRALPLAVEVSADGKLWMRVGYRRADFKNWTAKFPTMPVHYVRARADRVTYLHLHRIRVY